MIKISKKYLTKIIKEETAKVFEAHDEDSPSVTRPGEEDYTGHKGNKSKTHPGKDYMSDDDLMDYSKDCPQGWKDADCMVNKINDLVKDSLEDILTSAGELYGSIGDEQQEKIVSDLIFALEEPLLDLALEVGGSDEDSDLMEEDDWMQKAFSKKKGSLHHLLGVNPDKDIPIEKMRDALCQGGKIEQKARAAVNANQKKYASIKDACVEKKKEDK